MHWALKEPLVPRSESNLRAITCLGEVEEMPNTLLALTSLLPFLWFICFWKKKELQHIVVFNIYKGRFFVISGGKKKMLGPGEARALGRVIRFLISTDFQGKGPTSLDCKVPAGLGSPHCAP